MFASSVYYFSETGRVFQESFQVFNLCFMSLGEEHAHSVLEGSECVHCEKFTMRKLLSHLSLFSREEVQVSAPCGSGPTAVETWWKLSLWRSQVELWPQARSLYQSSDPDSMLLGYSCQVDDEEIDVFGDDNENVSTELSLATPSHAYGICWRCWIMPLSDSISLGCMKGLSLPAAD